MKNLSIKHFFYTLIFSHTDIHKYICLYISLCVCLFWIFRFIFCILKNSIPISVCCPRLSFSFRMESGCSPDFFLTGNVDLLHLGIRALDPLLTCRRDRPLTRWPLCACLQAGPGPVQHPAPASATPFSCRVGPSAPSLAQADGLWPSAWRGKWRRGGVRREAGVGW